MTSLGLRRRVGERLRAIRKQKHLSLQDVSRPSGQEFKASVLGAYERGERAISVPRLQRLAKFYNVPVDQLLPATSDDGHGGIDSTVPTAAARVRDDDERPHRPPAPRLARRPRARAADAATSTRSSCSARTSTAGCSPSAARTCGPSPASSS